MTATTAGGARLHPAQIDEPSTPLLRIIANNPRLVALYRELTRVLVRESELPSRDRWLITMRMAWRCRCTYEFGRRALDTTSKQDIDLVTLPLDSEQLVKGDRLLFALVDQVHANQRVDDSLWSELSGAYSPAQIVELLSVIGLYFMAASVANSCGVDGSSR